MRLRPSFAFAACCVLFALGALHPAWVRACSRVPTCTAPLRLFPRAGGIPGNLVFFKLFDQPGAAAAGTPSLHTSDGTPIPASVRNIGGDRVFAPISDLPLGLEVELEFDEVCPSGAALTPQHHTFRFTTGPAASPEPVTTSLRLLDRGVEGDTGFTRVQLSSSGVAVEHLTDSLVRVGFDTLGVASDGVVRLGTDCDEPELSTVDSCVGTTSFGAGNYLIVSETSVVGSGAEPVRAQLTVPVGCDATPKWPNVTVIAPPLLTTSTSEAVLVGDPDDAEAGEGCTLRVRSGTEWSEPVALALLLLVLGRRRSSR